MFENCLAWETKKKKKHLDPSNLLGLTCEKIEMQKINKQTEEKNISTYIWKTICLRRERCVNFICKRRPNVCKKSLKWEVIAEESETLPPLLFRKKAGNLCLLLLIV